MRFFEGNMGSRFALLITLTSTLSALVVPISAHAQPPADQLVPVADDVYYFLSLGYISLFIVTDEGVIATDPSSDEAKPNRAQALKDAIASVTDQPVRYVVYTHDSTDHSTGGIVFADTAEFVGQRLGVPKFQERNDPRTPVPTVVVDDQMALDLGGKHIELYYTGPNHTDNSLVLLYPARRLLFAVDFIPINALPFQDLPDWYVGEWIDSLRWIEQNLDFDILIPGHPPVGGTKDTVRQVREYVEALTDSVRSAQANGLADNSDEMVAAVRSDLGPRFSTWARFDDWLPLNIQGVLRIWAGG